jgi:hypothetical protein
MMITRLSGSVRAAICLSLVALPAAAQNQLWIQQFGTSLGDGLSVAAPDGSGGVFVAGSTGGSLGGPSAGEYDFWIARFDDSGDSIWVRQIGSTTYDTLMGGASDAGGGVVVCGYTQGNFAAPNAGAIDACLARYDAAGIPTWDVQIGTRGWDAAKAVASDGLGGVFVCGDTNMGLGGSHIGNDDVWFARYDGTGGQTWIRQIGTISFDDALAVISDGAGGLYLAGRTTGSLAGPNQGGLDAWLARYSGTGVMIWTLMVGTSGDDQGVEIASDGAGGVYLCGDTEGSLGGPNAGYDDAWLARYDAAGSQLWVRQFGSSLVDNANGISADGAGGVFLTGSTTGMLAGPAMGSNDAWLARYDSAGNLLDQQQFGSVSYDHGFAVASDGAGGAYVGGSTGGDLGGLNLGSNDAWLARYGSCGITGAYCAASLTSLPGCQAALSGSGSPTLSDPTAFTLSSGLVPGGNLGICLVGANGSASIPFGTLGGALCVQPPFFRTPPKASGGTAGQCNGMYNFLLLDLANASPVVVAGNNLHAQMWARDPANPDGFLLSDGIEFTVCP